MLVGDQNGQTNSRLLSAITTKMRNNPRSHGEARVAWGTLSRDWIRWDVRHHTSIDKSE